MSDVEKPRQNTPRIWTTYAILGSANGLSILLQRSADGQWTLPCLCMDSRSLHTSVKDVRKKLEKSIGQDLNISLLRHEGFRYENNNYGPLYTWLEDRSAKLFKPRNAQFLTKRQLDEIPTQELNLSQRLAIQSWFEHKDDDRLSSPWRARGWIQDILTQLSKAADHEVALSLMEPVEQLSNTLRGCVLRAKRGDSGGVTYLKICHPKFSEPTMSEAVGKEFPELVPGPFFVDRKRNLMLMRDYGRTIDEVDEKSSLEYYASVLKSLGQLHQRSLDKIGMLKNAGFPEWDFDTLKRVFAELASDEIALEALTEFLQVMFNVKITQPFNLRETIDVVSDKCDKLSTYDIPFTLVHGDLNVVNIIAPEDKLSPYKFFDWEYGFIGHPFFDVAFYCMDVKLSANISLLAHVEFEKYLEIWTKKEPIERVREAWVIAEAISELGMLAQMYRLLKVANPEDRQEIYNEMAQFIYFLWLKNLPNACPVHLRL